MGPGEGRQVYFLSEVTSRRPPALPPNWRTTYRLQCSALVAVARLAASQEALDVRDCPLQWAEIVSTGHDRGAVPAADQDHLHRQQGRVALRLLSRSDCHILQQFDAPLEVRA